MKTMRVAAAAAALLSPVPALADKLPPPGKWTLTVFINGD